MKLIERSLVVAVLVLSAAAFAQTPASHRGDTNGSSAPEPPTGPFIQELDVPAATSVAELLDRVRRQSADFQYIVAEPGDWQNVKLPAMKLHLVTQQQVVDILTNLVPELEVASISSSFPNVYIFRGRHPHGGPVSRSTQLNAFGLADPVARLGSRNAWADLAKNQDTPTAEQFAAGRKEALKEVLSLLESAATQADPSAEPSLKLHEETEVLLIRGTGPQLNAVSQALQALQSAETSNAYRMNFQSLTTRYKDAKDLINTLNDKVDRLTQDNNTFSQRAAELQKQ